MPLKNSFRNKRNTADKEVENSLKVLDMLVGENEGSKIRSNALRLIKSKIPKRKK